MGSQERGGGEKEYRPPRPQSGMASEGNREGGKVGGGREGGRVRTVKSV